jgi:hypothetical protein
LAAGTGVNRYRAWGTPGAYGNHGTFKIALRSSSGKMQRRGQHRA